MDQDDRRDAFTGAGGELELAPDDDGCSSAAPEELRVGECQALELDLSGPPVGERPHRLRRRGGGESDVEDDHGPSEEPCADSHLP
jgi:hypothetical protein